MKCAKQLPPLSRQHHLGLHVGRHAKECADNPQVFFEPGICRTLAAAIFSYE